MSPNGTDMSKKNAIDQEMIRQLAELLKETELAKSKSSRTICASASPAMQHRAWWKLRQPRRHLPLRRYSLPLRPLQPQPPMRAIRAP